jgi:transglutaminase-like putative cysteine protease
MIYQITHTTTYDYSDTVSVSYHLLRLHPRVWSRQRCLEYELRFDPRPALVTTHTDYFGNLVAMATVEGAHKRLTVTSASKVGVQPTAPPEPLETPEWEDVRDSCRGEQIGGTLDASEFIFDSPLIETRPEYADYSAPSFAAKRPLLEAVLDLTNRIHRDFKFDPKATTVATPLSDVFKHRRGVCQDFAHIEIACLRSLGLPARYISGYLETVPPPGRPRLVGSDASHAWVSFFCPGLGWIDVDPTNNLLPTTHHITVAWGRDFGDVSPIRGVLLGSGKHVLKVSVDVLPITSGEAEPVIEEVKPAAGK